MKETIAARISRGVSSTRHRIYYGWVIVAVSVVLMATSATGIYSFGVFFKPLSANFGWDRATTSGIQSLFWIAFATSAIGAGWLADRFGPTRILAICGTLAGIGLILTSQVHSLWQFCLTYSVLTGGGVAVTFPVSGTITARWFTKRQGLALGLVVSGTGLGSLFGVPIMAHLIEDYGWSRAYLILGITACVVMVAGALVLGWKSTRADDHQPPPTTPLPDRKEIVSRVRDTTLSSVLRNPLLWLIFSIFSMFSVCIQMVMTHLVNYATDLGIAPLIASTLVSGLGLGSIIGRLTMGTASDRIGTTRSLIIVCAVFGTGLLWLIFARELWMLYLFTLWFGFSYGGDIPLQPLLISKYFGLRVMLVGLVHGGNTIGGAIGTWMAGRIYDTTHSYQLAFLLGVAAIIYAFIATLILARRK